jgi:hypothetical protein
MVVSAVGIPIFLSYLKEFKKPVNQWNIRLIISVISVVLGLVAGIFIGGRIPIYIYILISLFIFHAVYQWLYKPIIKKYPKLSLLYVLGSETEDLE